MSIFANSNPLIAIYENGRPPPVGGRLSAFRGEWERSVSDRWVLGIIDQGYALEFVDRPPIDNGVKITPVPRDPAARLVLSEEIASLLEKKVIAPVPPESIGQGFYSTFFTVPKKTGGFRPILNLKPLNLFVNRKGFKLDSLGSVKLLLRPGDFTTSLDLKDAYLHVPIHPAHYKYLRFEFMGSHFQFVALPFGLASSPRVFCKVLAPVVEFLRLQGIHLLFYLDDGLLIHHCPKTLLGQTQLVIHTLEKLGWLISPEKSRLVPSQTFVFLGGQFDTVAGTMTPTPDRVCNLRHSSLMVREMSPVSVHSVLQLLGHIASLIDLVPLTRCHMRGIQFCLHRQWRPSTDPTTTMIHLDHPALADVDWWLASPNVLSGCLIWPPSADIVLTTDASLSGWGAVWGDRFLQGLWNAQDLVLHINVLEMKAVLFAFTQWGPLWKGEPVLVHCDNTTVVQYINRQGGTASHQLCQLALSLWSLASSLGCSIRAAHIAGSRNVLADGLSRGRLKSRMAEWSLHPKVVDLIWNKYYRPNIDLFASARNHKLPTYCAWTRDEGAWTMDSLSMSWEGLVAYAFPPFILIPRVLDQVTRFNCRVLLVAPWWPRRPWFSKLLELLADFPALLPQRQDLLLLEDVQSFHQSPEFLKLAVWPISGIPEERRTFLLQLDSSCSTPGGMVPSGSTHLSSESLLAGAVGGRSIPLHRL